MKKLNEITLNKEEMTKKDWTTLCETTYLTEEFVIENKADMDWEAIIKFQKHIDPRIIVKYDWFINWELLIKERKLDNEFLMQYCSYANPKFKCYEDVLLHQDVTPEYIRENNWEINWKNFQCNNRLTLEQIDKYQNYLNWYHLCSEQGESFTEEFIENHLDKINWKEISLLEKCFTLEFIERHINELDMESIVLIQDLPEEFLEKHGDIINWEYVFKYQNGISETFKKQNEYRVKRCID